MRKIYLIFMLECLPQKYDAFFSVPIVPLWLEFISWDQIPLATQGRTYSTVHTHKPVYICVCVCKFSSRKKWEVKRRLRLVSHLFFSHWILLLLQKHWKYLILINLIPPKATHDFWFPSLFYCPNFTKTHFVPHNFEGNNYFINSIDPQYSNSTYLHYSYYLYLVSMYVSSLKMWCTKWNQRIKAFFVGEVHHIVVAERRQY